MAERTRCEICDKEFKDAEGLAMHNKAKHESKNEISGSKKKMGKKWLWIIIGIAIVLIGIIYFSRGNSITEPGKYDDFAKCLTSSGTKMYGAYWCPHCANQKKLFGSSVKYIPYVECDPRGDNADKAACDAAGVEGFPTWVFPDGTKTSGEKSLNQLSVESGCELPA